MKKTAEFIEESKEKKRALSKPDNKIKIRKKHTLPAAARPFMWKPGQSGNPGGCPKNDAAKEIAQAVLEGNKEAAYAAFTKALLKGNAYVFKELADRAYGKVKETIEHSGSLGIVEVKARV